MNARSGVASSAGANARGTTARNPAPRLLRGSGDATGSPAGSSAARGSIGASGPKPTGSPAGAAGGARGSIGASGPKPNGSPPREPRERGVPSARRARSQWRAGSSAARGPPRRRRARSRMDRLRARRRGVPSARRARSRMDPSPREFAGRGGNIGVGPEASRTRAERGARRPATTAPAAASWAAPCLPPSRVPHPGPHRRRLRSLTRRGRVGRRRRQRPTGRRPPRSREDVRRRTRERRTSDADSAVDHQARGVQSPPTIATRSHRPARRARGRPARAPSSPPRTTTTTNARVGAPGARDPRRRTSARPEKMLRRLDAAAAAAGGSDAVAGRERERRGGGGASATAEDVHA